MPEFQYQAIDKRGKTISGSIEASSEREAKKNLRANQLTVLKFFGSSKKIDSNLPKHGKGKSKGFVSKSKILVKGSSKGE